MIAAYSRHVLYVSLLLLALPWLLYRSYRTGRYRDGWREKLFGIDSDQTTISTVDSEAPLIWLHGVSVGEVQLLKPLMEAIACRRGDARFAISTTTSTGMELAQRLFPAEVHKFYFPLDFSWGVQRRLDQLKPAILVLGELEAWPNLIAACNRRRIPIAVVNGRLSARSHRGYRRLGWLTRGMFAGLDTIAAQDVTYAKRFIDCGTPAGRVRTTGSIKFDNVQSQRDVEPVIALRRLVGLEHQTAPVFMLGSSQGPEELAALEAFVSLRSQYQHLKLIIVPRHRERFDEAYRQLQERLESTQLAATGDLSALKLLRRSQLQQPVEQSTWDVLLVDSIGELRWWWGLADYALVGGSFGSRGGQNMLEPAAYGASVAFGPRTENFRDIVELLLSADGATRLSGPEGIEPWLASQLQSPSEALQRGKRGQQVVLAQQGALERTVDELVKLLPDSRLRRRHAA